MDKPLIDTKFNHLAPEFISDFLYYFRKSNKNGNNKPGEKISLAIAFADLLLSDPAGVTAYHRNMLKKEFNPQEIDELIRLISDKLAD